MMGKIIFFANTDWYLYNFRLDLIQRTRQAGYEVLCISPPGRFAQKLLDAGVAWQPLPLVRNKSGLWSILPTIRTLRRIFREAQPDLIHSFTLTSILLTWMAAPRRLPARKIHAVTGLGYVFTGSRFKHRIVRRLLHPFLKRALSGPKVWTVVQNPTDLDDLMFRFKLDRQRMALITGSGVDVDRIVPRASNTSTSGAIRVAFVGRLLIDKGIGEFVEAAEWARARFPNARFFVAGEADLGNPASVSEARLNRWKTSGVVEFMGHVDNIAEFLGKMDIFVLPSTYREGLSRSLIEAGAAGLPCVTTDVPGCRDVVNDGENGILLPTRDSRLLISALERLLSDHRLRERMGQAARQRVVEHFSNEIINTKTLELYRRILDES